MIHISHKEFEILNWLSVTERFSQCNNSTVFKYVNNQCLNYLNKVFQTAPENNNQTRGSFLKLKSPFQSQRRPNGVVLHYSNHMEQNP